MSYRYSGNDTSGMRLVISTIVGIIAFIAVGILFMSWRDVDPGYLGIRFNKVSGEITVARMTPGNYFINPFTESTVVYPVRTRQFARVTDPALQIDNSVRVRDKESQRIGIDTVVNYHVDETKLGELYRKYGGRSVEDLEGTILLQAISTSVGKMTATRGWEEANLKKELLAEDIFNDLAPKFAATFMVLESVQIPDVELAPELEQLVAAKTNRLQETQTELAESEKQKVINQRAIDKALSEAEVQKARSAAEAEATLTRAKAQAEANRLLSESLTPQLVEYRKVDKWDGKLPVVSGDSTPMINSDVIKPTTGE